MNRPTAIAALFATLTLASLAGSACAQGTPSGGAAAPPAGMRFVYLVRHAIYDYDDPRDERIGKGLDSLGLVQARLTGQRFASYPLAPVDQLVSSTFLRAAQTADVIGEAIRMRPARDSMLCECTPNTNRADYLRDAKPGEVDTCEARLARAYATYMRPAGGREDRHDVLVAHGNVIRWWVTRALGMDTKRWAEFSLGNCSITAFQIFPDGRVVMSAFSDTGHLPAEAQTWTGRGAGWSPPMVRRPPRNMGVSAPAANPPRDTLWHTRPTNK